MGGRLADIKTPEEQEAIENILPTTDSMHFFL